MLVVGLDIVDSYAMRRIQHAKGCIVVRLPESRQAGVVCKMQGTGPTRKV